MCLPSVKVRAIPTSLGVLVILTLIVVRGTSRERGFSGICNCSVSVGVADKDPVDLPAEQSEKPVLAVLYDGILGEIRIDHRVVIAIETKETDPALTGTLTS